MNSIFEFSEYRTYLLAYLKAQPKRGRGMRGAWAEAAGCQIAYVSHVLNGKNNFSLEQAERISQIMGHSKEEQEFFLLMLQKERAGTQHLRVFFQKQMEDKLAHYHNVRHRMKIKESLKIEDQAIYYSKWHYSAIHILLTIPEYRTVAAIANYFSLPIAETKEYLDFLETRQLVGSKGGQYFVQGSFLHVSKDSPMFYQQQVSWRQSAIQSIYRNREGEIHFASCFSISAADVEKIRTILSSTIEDTTDVIKPSKEEKLFSICLDFFEVR